MNPKALFGNFFKTKRIANGLTLREFCKKFGLDPGNISKLERGLFSPPTSSKKLESYASFLGLKKGTNDWVEFFDRAAACRGEIPEDVLKDPEIVKNLPVIFRTIRGKKVSAKLLAELVEMIKKT